MRTITATGRPAVPARRSSVGSRSISELAQALFTSPLQISDAPSPHQIRLAADGQLSLRRRALVDCAAHVAQEAGDHPEAYAARMHWALEAVSRAYACRPAAA